jgi:hypothetical protein
VGRLSLFPGLKCKRRVVRACWGACVLVCLGAMGGDVLAQQPSGGAAVTEKAVLRGTVVNAVTRQPIGRALVKSTDGRFATMTNERGQFEMRFKEKKREPGTGFKSDGTKVWFPCGTEPLSISNPNSPVPGGRSQEWQNQNGLTQSPQCQDMAVDRPDFLTAVRVGYLNPQTQWGNAVAVARDQEEVTISLMPEAKVVGHVTLADGEGAADMPVELYRQTVLDGRMRWTTAGSAQARSDGEFRFADLEAGNYKLYSAELNDRDPVTSDPRAGQGWGYPPDYFPGATDFAGGAVIRLAAGETFQASLTPEKRRYYPVHIGVNNGGQGRQYDIQVERDGHPGPGFTLGNDFRDGSIGGMLPDGNYLVRISTLENGPLTGLVNLSVHGGPAAETVTLLGGVSIDVRVIKEFSGESPNYTISVGGVGRRTGTVPVMLQLMPMEQFSSGRSYMAQPSNDPASEGMVIEGVPAGEYRVTAQVPGGYVAAIRCGEKDLLESPLVIGGGASVPVIEVTLRNDGAEIDGSIAGMTVSPNPAMPAAVGPTTAAYVYVVPARGGGELKTVVSQPNGDFGIQQLAPGTYRVVAFGRPRNDLEFSDEDAMRKFAVQEVTVVAGQKEKVKVSLNAE